MGCDIHLHAEVKINGQWHHYLKNRIERDYRLFAKMASVRNEDNKIMPISKPKGLPNDISLITKIDADHWGADGHSHSWFGTQDIERLCAEIGLRYFTETFPFLFGHYFYDLKAVRLDLGPIIEDARFVFWFDN